MFLTYHFQCDSLSQKVKWCWFDCADNVLVVIAQPIDANVIEQFTGIRNLLFDEGINWLERAREAADRQEYIKSLRAELGEEKFQQMYGNQGNPLGARRANLPI